MDLKKLKEELKKANDPIKYLEELLKKTKDKKLRELIKQILEKREHRGESVLERTVRTSGVRAPVREPQLATVEVIEDDVEASRVGVRPDLVVEAKKSEDYGGKIGGKSYKTGSVIKQLEESHLVSGEGHRTTAETKGLIDKEMGKYDINKGDDKYNTGKVYERPLQHEIVKEDETFEDVFHRKKKKEVGDYVQ